MPSGRVWQPLNRTWFSPAEADRTIDEMRGVVVASGMWEDLDSSHRAGDLLQARGICSFVGTGVGVMLVVASDAELAARAILRADAVCGRLAMPDEGP